MSIDTDRLLRVGEELGIGDRTIMMRGKLK
jgi:hypothetical protein